MGASTSEGGSMSALDIQIGGINESDPNGYDANKPGAKLDAGKNRLGLVLGGFSRALQAVGQVGTFGANKYTDNGWISVPEGIDRYTDAMYRHLMAEAQGETTDPQTELMHAAHTAWNALARLDLMIRKQAISQELIALPVHDMGVNEHG
jgi:hypothetical protein